MQHTPSARCAVLALLCSLFAACSNDDLEAGTTRQPEATATANPDLVSVLPEAPKSAEKPEPARQPNEQPDEQPDKQKEAELRILPSDLSSRCRVRWKSSANGRHHTGELPRKYVDAFVRILTADSIGDWTAVSSTYPELLGSMGELEFLDAQGETLQEIRVYGSHTEGSAFAVLSLPRFGGRFQIANFADAANLQELIEHHFNGLVWGSD